MEIQDWCDYCEQYGHPFEACPYRADEAVVEAPGPRVEYLDLHAALRRAELYGGVEHYATAQRTTSSGRVRVTCACGLEYNGVTHTRCPRLDAIAECGECGRRHAGHTFDPEAVV